MTQLQFESGTLSAIRPEAGRWTAVNTIEIRKHRISNWLQSLMLGTTMALILGILAWLLWGIQIAVLAVAFSAALFLVNAKISPALVLRMYHARRLDVTTAPRLYAIVEKLAERAELDFTPPLFYLPSDVMNAFTIGSRKNAVLAVSDGLLRRLDLREVGAVLAHEISHIRFNDTRIMSFADLTSRLTNLLSIVGQFLLILNLPLMLMGRVVVSWWAVLLLIMAPTLSSLVQLALSRTREYNADLGAAELTGDPEALASALTKMERYQGGWLERVLRPGYQKLPEASLLRTHPSTSERVRRLMSMRDHRPDGERWQLRPLPVADISRPARIVAKDPHRPHWHRNGLWF